MNSFVEIRQLRKQYDPPEGVFAVGPKEGIDLEIHQGEIYSLLGPNGAGKTTCISMMSTLLTPTSGEISIGGYNVKKDPVKAKAQIGVVPQELALYPVLSARQNLAFFGRLYNLSGKTLNRRIMEVLEFIDLTDRADDPIETYSGGMKRRVNIGIGLIHRPKMVFLDEPTVGIDPQSRRKILDAVKLLNQEGMTVLYTTHYMEEAQELSDRVGIIDHGQIIAEGTIGELTQKVGEKDTLIISVPEATEEITAKIGELQGVDHVILQEQEEQIHVVAGRGRKVLPQVITLIDDYGFTVSSIEIKEPNLEAVFLDLTGRALRD